MTQNNTSWDDLVKAVRDNNREAVRQILAIFEFDINTRNKNAYTVAHVFGKLGDDQEILEMLIEAGMKLNVRNRIDGKTPLHLMVEREDMIARHLAAMMVEHGAADIYLHDKEGRSPIDIAMKNKDADKMMRAILYAGQQFSEKRAMPPSISDQILGKFIK